MHFTGCNVNHLSAVQDEMYHNWFWSIRLFLKLNTWYSSLAIPSTGGGGGIAWHSNGFLDMLCSCVSGYFESTVRVQSRSSFYAYGDILQRTKIGPSCFQSSLMLRLGLFIWQASSYPGGSSCMLGASFAGLLTHWTTMSKVGHIST